MKEGIFDIQLVSGPRLRTYDAENIVDGGRHGNWTMATEQIDAENVDGRVVDAILML
jgi:hypothetical protein